MTASPVATSVARAAGLIAVVTLLARIAGFGRTLVFSRTVGAGGVGDTYQSVNMLPNVVYEVAAGGVLAAVAVPLVAGQLGLGRDAEADETASALLTWAVAVLAPLALLLGLTAPWVSEALLGGSASADEVTLGTHMLVLFAPQVLLYGVGIVLSGVLQAHHRFLAAALAPLLSSLVVIVAYIGYAVVASDRTSAATVSRGAVWTLAGGTTLGVVVLSLPLLLPVWRSGIRLRPTLHFPSGTARRAGSLAGAGVLALLAQQAAVLTTLWITHHRTDAVGAVNVFTYVQAVYLLPYAVLAVPVATSAFPALAHRTAAENGTERVGTTALDDDAALDGTTALDDGAARDDSAVHDHRAVHDHSAVRDHSGAPGHGSATRTLARSLQAVLLLTAGAAAALMAVSRPVGQFFAAWDRGRQAGGGAALDALPGTLSAYAPGVVGFGVAALLTRALYVRGRPLYAALSVAAGWLLAAVVPLLVLPPHSSPGSTLGVLGVSSTVGMTVSAALLAVLVRRSWGTGAMVGSGRTLGAALVAMAVALGVGDAVAPGLDDTTAHGVDAVGAAAAMAALGEGLLVGAATVVTYLAVMMVADRTTMRAIRHRGRRRRGGREGSRP